VSNESASQRPTEQQASAFKKRVEAEVRSVFGTGTVVERVQIVYGIDDAKSSSANVVSRYRYAVTFRVHGVAVPVVGVYGPEARRDDLQRSDVLANNDESVSAALAAYSRLESAPVVAIYDEESGEGSPLPPGSKVWHVTTFDPASGGVGFYGEPVQLMEQGGVFRRLGDEEQH
jgi:hypothetical protein